jgi:hypothetical protein
MTGGIADARNIGLSSSRAVSKASLSQGYQLNGIINMLKKIG